MAVVLTGIILLSLSFQVIILRLSMPTPRVVGDYGQSSSSSSSSSSPAATNNPRTN